MKIEDGFKGGTVSMQVDKFGRARTFSHVATQETHATDVEVGYTYSFGGEIAIPDTFNGFALYVQNKNPGAALSLQKIIAGCDVAGLRMDLYRNPVIGTLTAHTTIIGVNNDFGSAKTAQSTAGKWDVTGTTGIGDLTGGDVHSSRLLGAGADDNPVDGSLNIQANNVLGLWIQNTTGGVVRLTLAARGFFKESGRPVNAFA